MSEETVEEREWAAYEEGYKAGYEDGVEDFEEVEKRKQLLRDKGFRVLGDSERQNQ
jgi:flagellar biosynthesis/type III secretory pathway protein FliH